MREYENVAYLDLQKTGSTTIKSVLENILDEEEVYRDSHGGIREDFDHSKLCFISAREPLSLYISLFNFGVGSRRGNLRNTLVKKGLEHYFAPTQEAFAHWLEFVLDPQNARLLRRDYAYAPYETIGLLSFRLLYISVPNSLHRMSKKKFRQPEQIRELFAKHLYEDYVRLENLGEDLFGFLTRHSARLRLRYPLTTAEALTAHIPKKNSSPKIPGLTPDAVPSELRQRVREREWLFYEAFGYDAGPKGRPPRCLSPETGTSIAPGDGSLSRAGRREAKRELRRSNKGAAV